MARERKAREAEGWRGGKGRGTAQPAVLMCAHCIIDGLGGRDSWHPIISHPGVVGPLGRHPHPGLVQPGPNLMRGTLAIFMQKKGLRSPPDFGRKSISFLKRPKRGISSWFRVVTKQANNRFRVKQCWVVCAETGSGGENKKWEGGGKDGQEERTNGQQSSR